MLNTVTHQRALAFFRSLADGNRLRLIGLLTGSEASLPELSQSLVLKPAVVRKQLRQLQGLGVVTARDDDPAERYQLDLDCLRLFCRELAEPEPTVVVDQGVVNALLQNHHPDCATLRRYLVDDGYLQRDHGIYWRAASESETGSI